MAFASIRSITGGSESNGTAPTYTLPATIESGDAILVIAGTDATATHTVPTGFTEISQQDATQFQVQLFGKVADGTEDGTDVDGSLSASESMCYIAMAIQDWSGDLNDIEINTIATGSGTSADPGSVTASWGSDDNLFIAAAIGDYYDKIATVFPTGYGDNQTTQQHSDAFGGTQAVSLATKESASASDDPSAFTLVNTTGNAYATFTIVVKPSTAADTATVDDFQDGETGVAFTYSGFASGAPDSVTIDQGDTNIAATNVSATGGSGTFDVPSIKDTTIDTGVEVSNFGSITIRVSNGTETADDTSTLSVATNWALVTLAALDKVTSTYMYQLALNATPTGITIDNSWECYYETTYNTTVNADGSWTSDIPDGTGIDLIFINRVSGDLAYPFELKNGSLSAGDNLNVVNSVTSSVITPVVTSIIGGT